MVILENDVERVDSHGQSDSQPYEGLVRQGSKQSQEVGRWVLTRNSFEL